MHLREVSRLLSTDAAFSSQVPRVANSALRGSRYEVTSVQGVLRVGREPVARWGDVIARHHDAPGHAMSRLQVLVHASCLAANMSGFRTAGPELPWNEVYLPHLLSSRNPRLLPPDGVLAERVTGFRRDRARAVVGDS
jgi:hypothetical protein